MITIVIAEDHALVREGLRNILEKEAVFKIVGEATNGLEAAEQVDRLKPDVLLLDLTLPRMHGLDVLIHLQNCKRTKVIIVSMHGDAPSVLEALKLGARGFVLKESPARELVEAIKAVNQRECFVSSSLQPLVCRAAIDSTRKIPDTDESLTRRERLVLQKVGEGLCSTEIGKQLGISAGTVGKHRANISRKIGTRNSSDMTRYALRHKLVEP
jgi:DNA-binding NarL/FixJ family response regulator